MRNRLHLLGAAFALAFLVLAPVSMALAQEELAVEEEVTLTGRLSGDEQTGYMLLEEASGDAISLQGSADFASHVGSTVNVTGTWVDDGQGGQYFEASKVEPAAAAPES